MPLLSPSPTWMSRTLGRLIDVTSDWSRYRLIVTSVALFAGAMLLDNMAGGALRLDFLYFVAGAFAAWCVGGRTGTVVSLLGALVAIAVRLVVESQEAGLSMHSAPAVWNLLSRALSFALFIIIVGGLRGVLMADRWRAAHDGLTGALNKTGFEAEATKTIARVQGTAHDLLLVFMDLDGFKEVNDQHGHAAGDAVLREFAAAAGEAIRPTDLFARFGGDEFAALLTLPREVDGGRIAEIVHQRFTAILAQTGFGVTCSMGATVMTGEDASTTGMMDEVDGLMYEVKRSGKNGLRLGAGTLLARALRTAFPPLDCNDLSGLLNRIDLAERRQGWNVRSAA